MRNTYKKLSIFCGILVLISASSCKKLLNQEPKNSTYFEAYWKTAKDAQNAIAGNYALLRTATNYKNDRYYLYGDAIAKNYFTIQYTGDGLEGIQGGDFTFQYNVNSLANYTLFYKAIAMSNVVIANVEKMTDQQLDDQSNPTTFRNNIIGQALFIRALSYFMMVRVWGDVPIVTEAYTDPLSAPQLPRSPKADVMKLIEDDCHKAAAMLSWGYEQAGDAHVTANRGSAYALLAHLYLWRATMLDVSNDSPNLTDVNSADTTINALLSKGGYSQTDTINYKNTFIGRSDEGIFELNQSENTLEGSNYSVGTQFLNTSYISYYGNNPRYFVVPGYLSSHFTDTTDIRYKKNFTLVKTDKPMCIKYSNVIYRNPGQKLDAYLSNNKIIFRLTDFILLKAEIALYKGNLDKAIEVINTSRKRNDPYPDLVAENAGYNEVMTQYIIERGKEMYLEGHIFYDLLRTRAGVGYINWLDLDRFRREGFYWPVDPALFRQNPYLKQTTYWLGKV